MAGRFRGCLVWGLWSCIFIRLIGYSSVEHVGKAKDEGVFDGVDLGHGELGVVELAVAEFDGEDVVDEVGYFLGGGFFDGAGGGFYGVGEGENGHFGCASGGTAVTEVGFVEGVGTVCFFELLFGFVVEEVDEAVAVVLFDGVENGSGEFVTLGECKTFFDVRYDDEGAHVGGEVVVGVVIFLDVFCEKFGFSHFADVVVVGADADK